MPAIHFSIKEILLERTLKRDLKAFSSLSFASKRVTCSDGLFVGEGKLPDFKLEVQGNVVVVPDLEQESIETFGCGSIEFVPAFELHGDVVDQFLHAVIAVEQSTYDMILQDFQSGVLDRLGFVITFENPNSVPEFPERWDVSLKKKLSLLAVCVSRRVSNDA